jgi:hypothetical protein
MTSYIAQERFFANGVLYLTKTQKNAFFLRWFLSTPYPNLVGRGGRDFPPLLSDFVFSDFRTLAPHWPLATTAHQKSENVWRTGLIRPVLHLRRPVQHVQNILRPLASAVRPSSPCYKVREVPPPGQQHSTTSGGWELLTEPPAHRAGTRSRPRSTLRSSLYAEAHRSRRSWRPIAHCYCSYSSRAILKLASKFSYVYIARTINILSCSRSRVLCQCRQSISTLLVAALL